MIGINQNDWVNHDIINKIIILNKKVSDMIHDVIPKKSHKYHTTTILEHAKYFAKVNQSP